MSADDAVARVWRAVERIGAAGEETIAIYVSDNGYLWGEHGLKGKFQPYLETLEVPLFVRWPGAVPAGGVDRRLALNLDIAPTIYEAVGVQPGYPVDGRSLLDPGWRREWVLFEGPSRSSHRSWPAWRDAYYDRRHHFIRWRSGKRELYDLTRDPFELRNQLASRAPRRRAAAREHAGALAAKLDVAQSCVGSSCP